MGTLIILDMQNSFSAANDTSTISHVVDAVNLARTKSEGIILVEYLNQGPTLYPIYKALAKYSNKDIVKKRNDDGSREIVNSIMRNFFDYQQLKVCGVNSDACVNKTVTGLSQQLRNSKIKVLKKACNTVTPKWNEAAHFEWALDLENVELVS